LSATAQLAGVMVALKPLITSYGFDARGNRTGVTPPGGTTTNLTYDQANRLTGYGATTTYTYDGDGTRASKTVSGSAEAFTWGAAGGRAQLLVDSTSSSTTYYIYGAGDSPIEQVTSAGVVDYYHQDELGSTRVVTDNTGTIVATYTYDAYGKQLGHTGSLTTPLGFAGQYTDAESGFQYLRARYYDPVTAQLLSRDPLVATTRSPYAYADDNPTNVSDASGLDPWWSMTADNPAPASYRTVSLGIDEELHHGFLAWDFWQRDVFDASLKASFGYDCTRAWLVGTPHTTHYVPQEGILNAEVETWDVKTNTDKSVTLSVTFWKLETSQPDHYINLAITMSPTGTVSFHHDEGAGHFMDVGFG
jgi:RHS repeat-associated protein